MATEYNITPAQNGMLVTAALRAQDTEVDLRFTIAEHPHLRDLLWPYVERARALSNEIAELYETPKPEPTPVKPGTILRVHARHVETSRQVSVVGAEAISDHEVIKAAICRF